jgi:hypothetical protein
MAVDIIGLPSSFLYLHLLQNAPTQSIFIDSDLLYVKETVKTTSRESIHGHSPY